MTEHGDNPMKPPVDRLFAAPRCGAKNRAGKPCASPAMKGRARCRLHGGKSTGAPEGEGNGQWKHGRRSRAHGEAKATVRALTNTVLADGREPNGRRSRLKVGPLADLERLYEAKGPDAIRTLRDRDPGAYLAALARLIACADVGES